MRDRIKWTMWTTFRQFLVKFSTLRQFWGQSSGGSFPAFPIPFRSMEELLQICEDSLCITDVFTFTVHASFSYFFFVSICITFFDSSCLQSMVFWNTKLRRKLCVHIMFCAFSSFFRPSSISSLRLFHSEDLVDKVERAQWGAKSWHCQCGTNQRGGREFLRSTEKQSFNFPPNLYEKCMNLKAFVELEILV